MTEAGLHDLLRRDVIKGKLKMPSPAALTVLAKNVNTTITKRLQRLDPGNAAAFMARSTARRALADLRRTLPTIIDALDPCIEWENARPSFSFEGLPGATGHDASPTAIFRTQQDALRRLEAAAVEAEFNIGLHASDVPPFLRAPLTELTPQQTWWHDYAVDLAQTFRLAIKSTNPDTDLGLSNTGPVVRFVATLAAVISGETPTLNAVARFLQRDDPAEMPF